MVGKFVGVACEEEKRKGHKRERGKREREEKRTLERKGIREWERKRKERI